jgi:hypothetical protein
MPFVAMKGRESCCRVAFMVVTLIATEQLYSSYSEGLAALFSSSSLPVMCTAKVEVIVEALLVAILATEIPAQYRVLLKTPELSFVQSTAEVLFSAYAPYPAPSH